MNGEGRVVMTGADIKGNIAPAIDIENCTSVTITGCNIGKANNSWPDIPNARINNKNGTVMIGNCTFDNNSKGIEIGSDADNFSITNNIFKPSSYESIIDNSSEKAYKIINNNLVRYLEKNKNTK